ncbi:MAG TPA: hypothetical protein VFU15_01575, partial [Bacteroidia bacterium]|nr:hypothetical protein [Bacteroidia bacterium]
MKISLAAVLFLLCFHMNAQGIFGGRSYGFTAVNYGFMFEMCAAAPHATGFGMGILAEKFSIRGFGCRTLPAITLIQVPVKNAVVESTFLDLPASLLWRPGMR